MRLGGQAGGCLCLLVPTTCLQVVRMGEGESGRAEWLLLGKPSQRGRQDPPCRAWGKGWGDPQ